MCISGVELAHLAELLGNAAPAWQECAGKALLLQKKGRKGLGATSSCPHRTFPLPTVLHPSSFFSTPPSYFRSSFFSYPAPSPA